MFLCTFNSILGCVARNIFGEGLVQPDLELELGPTHACAIFILYYFGKEYEVGKCSLLSW